MRKWKR